MTTNVSQPTGPPATQTMPPVVHDLFQAMDDSTQGFVLVGGHCSQCSHYFFPKPEQCPTCHETPAKAVFGGSGRIYSFTIVRIKAPFDLPVPYAVGYVDLEDVPLRIFGLLDPECISQLSIGALVWLNALPFGVDGQGQSCLRPVFTLSLKSTSKEGL